MKRNRIFSLICALALTMGLLIPCAAAAAQGPQLTVSSQEAAANQTVGLTALPADCQSLQITLTLSADADYTFTADSALADRSGVYTTYKQHGQNVTIYVTAKTGTLPDEGSLTLGVLSSDGARFTVEQASDLKVLNDSSAETVYPAVDVEDSGNSGGTQEPDEPTPPTEGGDGDGSDGTEDQTTYAITIRTSTGGKVTASAARAEQGEVITLNAAPNAGFELSSLTVTTSAGKKLSLADKGNGKYTFTMPAAAVAVTALFAPQETQPDFPFDDVAQGTWYYEGVRYAYEHGLMSGTGEGTFSPDLPTSRGMLVTILYRLAGSPAAGSASFTDVAPGQWYADGVAWASANGVVSGYTDGSFRPNDTITREQMAAILYQYARLQGKLDSGRADLSIFADVDDLSAYAKEPMSWAVAQGLFSGVSADMLAPGGSTTRAQAAVILTAFSKALG